MSEIVVFLMVAGTACKCRTTRRPSLQLAWLIGGFISPRFNFLHEPVEGGGCVVVVHQSVALKMERPLIFCTAAELRGTGFYFREATLKALFLILASDSGKRFGADDWSLNPNLEELRGMAPEVFPQL